MLGNENGRLIRDVNRNCEARRCLRRDVITGAVAIVALALPSGVEIEFAYLSGKEELRGSMASG